MIGSFEKLQSFVFDGDVTQALREVDKIFPLYDWVLAKGRIREGEPLYAFQIMTNSDEVVAVGEDDDMLAAVEKSVAVAMAQPLTQDKAE